MRCVFAGSRGIGTTENGQQLTLSEFPLAEQAFTLCEWHGKITEIVSGEARGADNLGEQIAIKRDLKIARFPANWKKHGRAAGHIRNKEMAEYTDIAIILWDGHSRGSKNMIDNMKRLGKPCLVFHVTNGELCQIK